MSPLINPTFAQLSVAFHGQIAKRTKNDALPDYTSSVDPLIPYFTRYSIVIECVPEGYLILTGDTSIRTVDAFLARGIVVAMLRAEGVEVSFT